ncbi:MAG: hypothetical protein ACMXX7_02875 [Candidatus Woesearchaeota archaeon]
MLKPEVAYDKSKFLPKVNIKYENLNIRNCNLSYEVDLDPETFLLRFNYNMSYFDKSNKATFFVNRRMLLDNFYNMEDTKLAAKNDLIIKSTLLSIKHSFLNYVYKNTSQRTRTPYIFLGVEDYKGIKYKKFFERWNIENETKNIVLGKILTKERFFHKKIFYEPDDQIVKFKDRFLESKKELEKDDVLRRIINSFLDEKKLYEDYFLRR